MARGRRGVYKAEKRKKELKRQAKQEAKRKRRLQKPGELDPDHGDNDDQPGSEGASESLSPGEDAGENRAP